MCYTISTMAVYKVAQDVEADDKLIGPFSARQFVYLGIVALAIALAWGLAQLFVGLAIIPLPIIVVFGALALPLRKDQPMEVYLGALLSFYLKPRRRTWEPDGIESLIRITAPQVIEVQRTKDITESEAERRLSYLADIADTQGWAVRHLAQPAINSMTSDAFYEAQSTVDVLDDNGGVAQSFDAMITQSDQRRKQEAIDRMHQQAAAVQPPAPQPVQADTYALPVYDPYAQLAQPQPQQALETQPQIQAQVQPQQGIEFNPYPTIRQSVIQPLDVADHAAQSPVPTMPTPPQPQPLPQAPQPPQPVAEQAPPPASQVVQETPVPTTSEKHVSPDIINLASNTDLSIETIQREANRIQKKEEADDGEVFISLH